MRNIGILSGTLSLLVLGALFGTLWGAAPAQAQNNNYAPGYHEGFENCAVQSYDHCMDCGAKYGYTGRIQSRFCIRHGLKPAGGKKKKTRAVK